MTPTRHLPLPTIILDIDDVICMSWPYGGFDVIENFAGTRNDMAEVLSNLFDRRALSLLRRIHEAMHGQVAYTISSTWRTVLTRDQMVQVFMGADAGFIAEGLLDGDAWATPVIQEEDVRAREIALWLQAHGTGQPFVILDDTYSGTSLVPVLSDPAHPWHWRTVICKEHVGLVLEHFGEAVAALNRPL